MRIDAHTHLWLRQNGLVNGKPVRPLEGGRSLFGDEIRQMLPPYMTDGENTVERLLSNMDFAGINGAVVTQEYIDGCQDDYLRGMEKRTAGRVKVCSLYEDYLPDKQIEIEGFSGIKICASRLKDPDLLHHASVFACAAENGKFLSIDLMPGALQCGMLAELAEEYQNLPIAVGHFGMAGRQDWLEQIKLARKKNVFIECGGITWLYNDEFYPYPSAVAAIRQAVDLVGMKKLMWGSDYPRTMTAITYRMSLDFIVQSELLSEEEKILFLGENAAAFYGFEPMADIARIKHMAQD